ncbi:MAG: F0F1 ATP synthase subunit B [bacterium]
MEGLPLSFDPKIFLFSLLNFGILFFVLKKFLFMPIYNILEERKKKVKESMEQIKKISEKMEEADMEKNKIISSADKKSQEIIKEAEKTKVEIIKKGKEDLGKIIESSKESIEKERNDFKKEMHSLLIDLVSSATNKVLAGVGKKENQKDIMEAAILESLKETPLNIGEIKK